jgi:hypothetical protein
MFHRVFGVSLSLLLIVAVQPAFAQRVPSGSYQQSCVNYYVKGGTLFASCSATKGSRRDSSISTSCNGDIGNVNGYLRCNGGGYHGGGYGGGLPSGSYQQSCHHAFMRGSVLTASCSAANGRRITSSLNINNCRRHSDIGNRNGYLGC